MTESSFSWSFWSRAEAALVSSQTALTQTQVAGSVGEYGLLCNSCTTYAAGVLSEAGIVTLPASTPGTLLVTTALQSPAVVQPLAASGAATNLASGVAEFVSASDEATESEPLLSVDPGVSLGSTGGSSSAEHSSDAYYSEEPNACYSAGESSEEFLSQACY